MIGCNVAVTSVDALLSDSEDSIGFVVDFDDSDTSNEVPVSFVVVASCEIFNFVVDTVSGVFVAAFVASNVVGIGTESVCTAVISSAVELLFEIKIGALGDSLCGALMLGIAVFQWLNAACKNFCCIGFVNTLLAVL